MSSHKIRFLPSGIEIISREGDTILKTAMRAGIHINASCGGAGVCNKCKIFIEDGDFEGERLSDGGIKACTALPHSDITVRVPVESEMDRRALEDKKKASWMREATPFITYPLDPPVKWHDIEMTEPSMTDQSSDLERLLRHIKGALLSNETKKEGNDRLYIDISSNLLYDLPHVLRNGKWKIRAFMEDNPLHQGYYKIIKLKTVEQQGNKRHCAQSIAIDLGTTTISVELLDNASGNTLSLVSDYNPQVSYGEDVISRMEFAKKEEGLKLLRERVVSKLSALIKEAIDKANSAYSDISHIAISGNTVMTHLMLGLETRFLRAKPYIPVATHFPVETAKEMGLEVAPEWTRVFLSPCVASYVGGDIVAGIIGMGINETEKMTLFIDIGTNGEIVLGNRDWMACAACSAGPAFEGGGIKHGMRATTGAVEVVHIHPKTFEPMALTIGSKKAKGICGSGIISLLAGLFEAGVIDRQGKFKRDLNTPRVREGRDGWEYVVVPKGSSATETDIVFTEADIENLIRAKGAMFAGYLTLLESVGMSINDIEQVILAGNFGSYIDLEQAITIGLLPDIDRNRFFFAGNTSLRGSRAIALSKKAIDAAKKVADMMTHFDLSDTPTFMDHYVSSLFLPHTDLSLFPSVRL